MSGILLNGYYFNRLGFERPEDIFLEMAINSKSIEGGINLCISNDYDILINTCIDKDDVVELYENLGEYIKKFNERDYDYDI